MSKHGASFHLLHHRKTHNSKWLLIGDILGWVGAVSLISAYFLASTGVVSGQSPTYQVLNIVGAFGLLALALARRAIPSVATNIVWLIIGFVAIARLFF
ncbi:MAG: hypothetical protein LBG75_03345 [Candidatus Nomurabacteria bacterium]|jgi:hypothetical protein|nr:hypothetical protein [Candidatus Nomurabacteria bacterium]